MKKTPRITEGPSLRWQVRGYRRQPGQEILCHHHASTSACRTLDGTVWCAKNMTFLSRVDGSIACPFHEGKSSDVNALFPVKSINLIDPTTYIPLPPDECWMR